MKRTLRYIANIYYKEDGKLFCKQLLNQDTIESIKYDVISFAASHNVSCLEVEVLNYNNILSTKPQREWYSFNNGKFIDSNAK